MLVRCGRGTARGRGRFCRGGQKHPVPTRNILLRSRFSRVYFSVPYGRPALRSDVAPRCLWLNCMETPMMKSVRALTSLFLFLFGSHFLLAAPPINDNYAARIGLTG